MSAAAFLARLETLAAERREPPDATLRRARRDPALWGRLFCPHLVSETAARFHDDYFALLARALSGQPPFDPLAPGGKLGIVCAAPRGFGKSTISRVGLLWAICEGRKRHILVLTGTDQLARQMGLNLRAELEQNAYLRAVYGDLRGRDRWGVQHLVIPRPDGDVTVTLRGAGAAVRGLTTRAGRPDAVVCDDVDSDRAVRSESQRRWLVETWWAAQVRPMLDPTCGVIIALGTILHPGALLPTLLAQRDLYETRVWSCYDERGESVWPERFPTALLRRWQRENPVAFAQEFLNDPTQTGLKPFPPERLRFYARDEVTADAEGRWFWRGQPLTIVAGVDPAISERESADQFALVVLGVTADRSAALVLRALLDRRDFAQQVDAIAAVARAFAPRVAIGIEINAYQRALLQQTRRELRADARLVPIHHGAGDLAKERRILALAPLVAQGTLYLSQASPSLPDAPLDDTGRVRIHPTQYALYRQLVDFPAVTLRDGLDALALAIETLDQQARVSRVLVSA